MTTTMKLTVSQELKNLLPSPLIDYLWDLANTEPLLSDQLFFLQKQTLGGKQLEEIRHITGQKHQSIHKVFGFEPVNITIMMAVQKNEIRMESVGLLEALSFSPVV